MFMWGSAAYYKMGMGKTIGTVDQPTQSEWKIEKTGFYTETGSAAMRYSLSWLEPSRPLNYKKSSSTLSSIKAISWGDSHGTMLDTNGRLFSMGASQRGRLGLADRNIPAML